MFPWARLVMASSHLTEGHHEVASTDHADGLEEAFHGHHHDDDATPHTHPLVRCDFSAQRSRTIDGVALPAALPAFSVMLLPPAVPASAPLRNVVTRQHSPPGTSSSVILRI